MIELVLGGARSGKSTYAEQQATNSGLSLVYIATASAGDNEMLQRITLHQQQRSQQNWQTFEEPLFLADTLLKACSDDVCIVVDCLTLWLSNCLLHKDADFWQQQKTALLAALPCLTGKIIFVSNEVGQGIVPLGEINRRFVDESGWLHQAIAKQAKKVVFVTAGLPNILKESIEKK